MTDFSAADDEVVSAYLDGEASTDEVARVESDPQLRARAEHLRATAATLRDAPAAVDTGQRDRAIAAALAAADDGDQQPVPDDANAPHAPHSADAPAELAARRSAGASRRFQLVSVAAALAVLLAAASLVFSRFDRGDTDGDFAATTLLDDMATREGAAGSAGGGDGVAGDTMMAAAMPSLGSFGSQEELSRAASAQVEARTAAPMVTESPNATGPAEGGGPGPSTTTVSQSESDAATDPPVDAAKEADALGCAHQLKDDGVETGELLFHAEATYEGEPVFVFVFERTGARGGEPERHLWVQSTDCSPVFDRAI